MYAKVKLLICVLKVYLSVLNHESVSFNSHAVYFINIILSANTDLFLFLNIL